VEGPDDAKIGVLAMGSVVSTFREAMDCLAAEPAKLMALRAFPSRLS